MEAKEEGFVYVYGITNNKDIKLNIKGLRGEPIKKINFKDISALTSPYPTLHPILKEEEAVGYSRILRKIMKKTTIIPMSIGTVFKNQEILETVLSKSYQIIKETLKLIDSKVELGVKVLKGRLEDADSGAASEILESLNKLSVKSVKGDSFSERLLLNYSFLVEKAKFPEFSDKIAELERKYKDLKFLYSGPWPPHNFVDIRIGGS